MSEDEQKPPVRTVEPAKFPEGYNFPEDLLSAWIAIPPDEPVLIGPLTRGDLDNLLFSISDIVRAVAYLREGLIAFSQGNNEVADNCLQSASNMLTDGETRNRFLFKSIMESVLKVRRGTG